MLKVEYYINREDLCVLIKVRKVFLHKGQPEL